MNEVLIDGVSSFDLKLGIESYNRPLLPEILDEYKDIEGRDGRKLHEKPFGMRVIDLTLTHMLDDEGNWHGSTKNIVSWLFTKKEVKVQFDDEPGVYYIGKVTEAPLPEIEIGVVSTFDITLTCQPLKYGQEITTDKTEFNYNGTYESPFLIRLENVSTSELTVAINDVEMTYTGQLSNATVTIDSDELELRVDGELKVFEVEGYFSFLQPGQNTIDINIDVDTTVEFTELFL